MFRVPFDIPSRAVALGAKGLKVLQDLFKGPANLYWDLGRWVVGASVALMVIAAAWNMHIGEAIELGPDGLGGGLAALLTAGAALIAAKDYMHKRIDKESSDEAANPE
jgi:hypothetical protein